MAKKKEPYFLADGTEVPSVTQITGRYKESEGLNRWYHKQGWDHIPFNQTRDKAGDIGSAVHHLILQHIMESNEEGGWGVNLDHADAEVVSGLFTMFKQWWAGTEVEKIVAAEKPMVSEKYRYGGTSDLIGITRDARTIILDWKTSKDFYQEMQMQMAAYRQLCLEVMGVVVDTAFIVKMAKDRPEMTVFEVNREDMDEGMEKFLHLRAAYAMETNIEATVERIRHAAVKHDYRS